MLKLRSIAFLRGRHALSMSARTLVGVSVLAAALLTGATAFAVNPNVKGRVTGQDKLFPDVYVEASKTEAHRFTWREPSPAVDGKYRTLAANPSRDLCIAAVSSNGGSAQDAMLMSVTGGRIFPTTIVVAPNQKLQFKNFDPFPHRLYLVGNPAFKAENQTGGGTREWMAPTGAGKYEFRDELFPSVRTFVLVDPQVVSITYPGREGTFTFALAGGDYVLKAFFNGHQVGQPVTVVAKDRGVFELKDPFNVGGPGDGTDAK